MKTKIACFRWRSPRCCCCCLQAPAFAHHGVSAYDVTKQITLKGVVTDFQFINPHSEVRLDVTDDSGHTVSWLCEAGSLNFLVRRGWSRNSLKAGVPDHRDGQRLEKRGRPTCGSRR